MFEVARSNAKWDHKPVLKKHISSYFHKKLTNANGKPTTVFGTMIPGDKKYLYDHDIWSNIHYGYAGRLGDIYSLLLDGAGRLNDVVNGHFSDVIGDKNTDANAVRLGMHLFDEIMNSNAYLWEKGEEHNKLVEIVKQHFEAKEEYRDLTALLNMAADAPLYVWITQGDDLVRAEHAERDGGIFDMDNPPDGGNPGEAYNCRCMAVSVFNGISMRPLLELRQTQDEIDENER